MHYTDSEHHDHAQLSAKGTIALLVAVILLVAVFEFGHEYFGPVLAVVAVALAFGFRLDQFEQTASFTSKQSSPRVHVDGGTLGRSESDEAPTDSHKIVSDGGSFERNKFRSTSIK